MGTIPEGLPSLSIHAWTDPLLEREAELELVERLLFGATEGRGALVLFEGAAGIGKSRLLGAACEGAEALGLQVLRARGGELERDFSYGVVRQLFEPRLAACGEDERERLLVGAARLAAPLFEFGEVGETLVSGADVSYATLHGLFWLTANLAELAPVVLAVDDLHWCDSPSLRSPAQWRHRNRTRPRTNALLAHHSRHPEPVTKIEAVGSAESLLQLTDDPGVQGRLLEG